MGTRSASYRRATRATRPAAAEVGELAPMIAVAAKVEHQVGELAPALAAAPDRRVGELAPVITSAAEVGDLARAIAATAEPEGAAANELDQLVPASSRRRAGARAAAHAAAAELQVPGGPRC